MLMWHLSANWYHCVTHMPQTLPLGCFITCMGIKKYVCSTLYYGAFPYILGKKWPLTSRTKPYFSSERLCQMQQTEPQCLKWNLLILLIFGSVSIHPAVRACVCARARSPPATDLLHPPPSTLPDFSLVIWQQNSNKTEWLQHVCWCVASYCSALHAALLTQLTVLWLQGL